MVMHVEFSGIPPSQPPASLSELHGVVSHVHMSTFRQGLFFLPDSDFHTVETEQDLKSSMYDILRWLEVKPAHLTVSFGPVTSIKSDNVATQLSIDKRLATNPFRTTAVLTHLVGHYVLNVRAGIYFANQIYDEAAVTEFLVSSGLGLVLANGLTGNYPGRHDLNEPVLIKSLVAYTRKWRIDPAAYAGSLAPWTKNIVPAELKPLALHRHREPVHITNHLRNKRRQAVSMAAFCSLVFTLGIWGIVNLTSSDPQPSYAPQTADMRMLGDQLSRCTQPSHTAPLAEFTPSRAICTELRSYYEYKASRAYEF